MPNSIKENAFYECKNLTSVTIPSSTDTIESGAFSRCLTLYQIKIPKSLHYIGYGAFESCGITSITLPDSIKSINESTFWGCQGLKSITIPEAVLHIGSHAFYRCISLKSVLFQNSRDTIIGSDAFAHCSLQSFTIPNKVKHIGNAAFYNCCNLSSVTIPASVSTIEDLAFYSCTNLKTIYAYPEVPVALPSEKVFNRVDKDSCRLLVPNESLDLYKSATVWKDFIRVESIVTSIKNIENPDELIIYPNPATDILNIKAKEGQALIYDSKGQLKISRALKEDNSINISSLTPGFYVVNVNGASYKVLKK
ncbi:MAG: leucine-rich repeat protein [Draconibacterium sp.]